MLVQQGTSYFQTRNCSGATAKTLHSAWKVVFGLLPILLCACGEFSAQGLLFLNSPELLSIRSKSLQTQLRAGDILEVEAVFSDPIEVEGTPGINLSVGDSIVWANYLTGTGSETLTFHYTVASNITASEITISTDSPFRESETSFFKNSNGTKKSPKLSTSLTEIPIKKETVSVSIDSQPPEIIGLSMATTTGAYNAGDTITVYVLFSETINLTGSPTIPLEMGATDRTVSCVSDPGNSNRLQCSYTIQAGDTSGDLDVVSGGSMDLTGVTIEDEYGNFFQEAGVFSFPLPTGSSSGSLAASASVVIDTTAPAVLRVTSSQSNGSYPALSGNMNLSVDVVFTEPIQFVSSGGRLSLELDVDNEFYPATSSTCDSYSIDQSSVSSLTVHCYLRPGDYSSDLDYASTTALTLTGSASITDSAGNSISLTLPAPGTANSLSDQKNLIIDARSQVKKIYSSRAPNISSTPTLRRSHRCALLADGQARCWGSNLEDQTGHEDLFNIAEDFSPLEYPTIPLLTGTRQIKELALGANFTCAIFESGQVGCWGRNNVGQLGTVTPGNLVNLGVLHARKIAAGWDHTCVILSDGTVGCWGGNSCGQLGVQLGTENCTVADSAYRDTVQIHAFGGTIRAIDITAGDKFTCVLMEDASVKCWGQNDVGQLGANISNTNSTSLGPQNTVLTGLPAKPVTLSSGRKHTCALLANGSVFCWGNNNRGQLGIGNTPTALNYMGYGTGAETMDISRIAEIGTVNAITVEAGDDHSCAILDTGDVRCWGDNNWGQLGLSKSSTTLAHLGTIQDPSTEAAISLGGKAIGLALGLQSTCALLSMGEVKCWGFSDPYVPLGYPQVLDGLPYSASDLTTVFLPGAFTYHILGDDEHPSSYGTIAIGGSKLPKKIASGHEHNCALFTDGTLKCWGDASDG